MCPVCWASLSFFAIIVGMGFVSAALCGLVLGQQAPAPQKIWQGFGVNIHFTEPARGEMDLLRAAGMEYVRMDFTWELTERGTAKYDFSTYDKLLANLKSARVRPLFVLDYGNRLYDNGAPKSEKAQDAYAAWAAAVVTHYKNEEIVWEIWNEPNVDNFWKPRSDAASYATLALKAAKAMRQADPNCRIIAPAVSRIDDVFLKKVLSAELLGLIDGVSLHPYRSSGPETVWRDYARVQEIIRARAPLGREELPVVCSEWGYSTYSKGDVTEERQAMYLAKSWLLSAAAGSPISIFYDWKDDGPDPANKEHRYGIVRSNLGPKPAFDAARLCLKAFKGCTYFRRMEKKDPLDWVIIGVGEGKMVRATWYQKVAGLPKFEAYDMSDRANRQLYNRLIAESKVPSARNIDTAPPPKKDPPKKDPPKTDPPKNDPPRNTGPIVKTRLSLAFAPPIDAEGWCAIIGKPQGMANAKVEFRYERKETGAKVTAFVQASSERIVEPLAITDADSALVALLNGQKIADCRVQKVDIDPSAWEFRAYKGTEFVSSPLMTSSSGASKAYEFSSEIQKCGLAPTNEGAIPEGAKRFVIWVKPDGSNNSLYARVKDEAGNVYQLFLGTLDSAADRQGWRAVVIPLSDIPGDSGLTSKSPPQGKLRWEHILYIEAGNRNQPKSGKLEFGPAAYEF